MGNLLRHVRLNPCRRFDRSQICDKTPEIARFCHESGEPVFITKNGVSDLVVISAAAYERDQARLKLYELLDAAEEDARRGDRGVTVKRLAAILREAWR
jgi:PHD/YefM family antitoxin component YafN of YafNO toxin-antitoxin module